MTDITADTDKVITGIMKQNECMKDPESQETADNTEQSARRESLEPYINSTHTDSTVQSSPECDVSDFMTAPPFVDQACSLQAQGPITWAKTVQVIYFQEPKVRSVQKLLHHFATRPRHNEHMEQCQEEDED